MWKGSGFSNSVVFTAYIHQKVESDAGHHKRDIYTMPTESIVVNGSRRVGRTQTGANRASLCQYSLTLGGFTTETTYPEYGGTVLSQLTARNSSGNNPVTVNLGSRGVATGKRIVDVNRSAAAGVAVSSIPQPQIQALLDYNNDYTWVRSNVWHTPPVSAILDLKELGRIGHLSYAPAASGVGMTVYADALMVGNGYDTFEDNRLNLLLGYSLGNSYEPSLVRDNRGFSGASIGDKPAWVGIENLPLISWTAMQSDSRSRYLVITPVVGTNDSSNRWPEYMAIRLTVEVAW